MIKNKKLKRYALCFSLVAGLSMNTLLSQNLIIGLSGSGAENDPVLLSNADDLRLLSAFIYNDVDYSTATANKYFKLTNNITFGEPIYDLDGDGIKESNMIPIGGRRDSVTASDYRLFQGIFNGDGHIIRNMQILYDTTVGFVGLFGCTWGATIENVGIESSSFKGAGCVAALSGQINYASNINACFVRKCNVEGNYLFVGGLCGAAYSGSTIKNSYITSSNVIGTNFVGGLLGINSVNQDNISFVTNSYSFTNVWTTNNSSYYGGFCGYSTNDTAIINCYYNDNWQQSDSAESGLYSLRGNVKTLLEMQNDQFVDTLNNEQDSLYWKIAVVVNKSLPILYWEEDAENFLEIVSNENSISIYPNPATEKVFISLKDDFSNKSVCLYDVFGRMIAKQQVYEAKTELDISKIPVGTYLVSIIREGIIVAKNKLVKK
ncbi:MAG: T9SS type A sorting domain-containing protein [Bacteroidales bacterium]|jgi:hypothetical protein|nr:T9SS type A sorting domain-containing protein [Bacteroidales bacterium]